MQRELDNLGTSIQMRRIKSKATLTAFSESVGISVQQVSNVENGNNWPSLPAFIAICRKLKAGKIPLVDSP